MASKKERRKARKEATAKNQAARTESKKKRNLNNPAIVANVSDESLKKKIVNRLANKREAPTEEWVPESTSSPKFTEALAIKYLNMDSIGVERDPSDRHTEFLTKQMASGKFLWHIASLAIADCSWDDRPRKLNGQHTCWARLAMPEDYQPVITVDRYVINTEDEYRELYSRFDRGAPRSSAHVTQVNLSGTSEFDGISNIVLSKLAAGFRQWRKHDSKIDTRDPESIADALRSKKYVNTCLHVAGQLRVALSKKETKGAVGRSPVVAAMMETYAKSVTSSGTFWEKVISGLEFKNEGDCAKKARDYLMTRALSANKMAPGGELVSTADMYNVLVTLYNDHKNNKIRKIMPKAKAMKGIVTAKR